MESLISFVCTLSPLKASKRGIIPASQEKIGLSFPNGLVGVITILLLPGLAQLLEAVSTSLQEKVLAGGGEGRGLVWWFSVEEFAFDLCKGISRPTTSPLTLTVEVSFSDPLLLCRLFVQQRYLLQVFVRIIICEKKAGCAHFLLRFPSLPLSPALIPLCKDLPDLETAPGI